MKDAGLRVIGAGLMRTGTTTLKAALEQILCGKCYHMLTVLENPHHAAFWISACTTEPSDEEWREFLKDYNSAVGFPAVAFYESLSRVYPDAKVILTERNAHRWTISVKNDIARYLDLMQLFPLNIYLFFTKMRNLPSMTRRLYRKRFGDDILEKLNDQNHMISVFEEHVRRVRSCVPSERLLVFRAFESWHPLCQFLDKPEPKEQFPYLETTAESVLRIEKLENQLKFAKVALFLMSILIAVFLAFIYEPYVPLKRMIISRFNLPDR